MKKLGLLLPFILLGYLINGQTLNQYIKAADEAFEKENYYFALTNYRVALEIDSTRNDLYLKAAESSRRMLGYKTASDMYDLYLNQFSRDSVPDRRAFFWYGLSLMNQGFYDSASLEFKHYLNLIDSNEIFYGQKARLSLESCQFSQMLINNPLNVAIDTALKEVNTPFSEVAPFVKDGKLYYSSMDFSPRDENPKFNINISKVLSYDFGEDEKEILNENVNDPNLLTGNLAFNQEGDMAYFTICRYLTGAEIRCQIYSSEVDGDGNFSARVRLPENINLEGTTSTQPTIMNDPSDGRSYLIFVSDRSGGEGKMDMYRSEILGDNLYGTPQNLTELNTFDDDMTPFYSHENSKLYFATRGRKGLGELDIYQSSYKNGKWENISNLGYPINSSTNDFGPYIAPGSREGYFASNRSGSILFYEEEEACCYDIYRFRAVSQSRTIYLSTLMNTPLEINVEPIDPNKDIISVLQNCENGKAIQNPDSLLQYIYLPTKDYVGEDKIVIGLCSDNGMDFCDTINYIIDVRPIPVEIHEFTTKEFTKLSDCIPLIGFSDADSLTITPCDDGLQNGKIDYTVIGDKLCFEYLPNYGFLGRDELCLEICNNDPRDKCVRKIIKFNVIEDQVDAQLPVVLYFDNDQPLIGKTVQTTNYDYLTLHGSYLKKKDEFIGKYIELLTGQEKIVSNQEMTSFFDNVISECSVDLDRILNIIERLLRSEDKIQIHLKGFTSPRAAEGYNKELSKRRINSVVNYLSLFNDGALKEYLDNGSLTIVEEPIGEAQAPEYVSDKINDPRNSVYSIEASVERRVEIVDVKRISKNDPEN